MRYNPLFVLLVQFMYSFYCIGADQPQNVILDDRTGDIMRPIFSTAL